MAEELDVSGLANQILNGIKTEALGILGAGIETVRGFSERQLKFLAHQTALVSLGIASGEITEETKEFFEDNLVELAANFINALKGLLLAVLEKLRKVIIDFILKALSSAIPV